jgi:hypothetical protein
MITNKVNIFGSFFSFSLGPIPAVRGCVRLPLNRRQRLVQNRPVRGEGGLVAPAE